MDWNRWIVTQAKLRETPGGKLLCEIPFGSLVYATGNEHVIPYGAHPETRWIEIIYQTSLNTYHGWTYSAFVEPYDPDDHRKVIPIPNPTQNPQDAAQYMVWRGQVQYNLCGELCACYVTGAGIEYLLERWQAQAPSVFNYIFYGGRSRVTGLYDLDSMLGALGMSTPSVRFADPLIDPVLGRVHLTPSRLEACTATMRAIVGVKINYQGRLRPSGIPHWVVLVNCWPRGIDDAAVEIYNPFTNEMEHYSWYEFTASMGAPLGLWVRR